MAKLELLTAKKEKESREGHSPKITRISDFSDQWQKTLLGRVQNGSG